MQIVGKVKRWLIPKLRQSSLKCGSYKISHYISGTFKEPGALQEIFFILRYIEGTCISESVLLGLIVPLSTVHEKVFIFLPLPLYLPLFLHLLSKKWPGKTNSLCIFWLYIAVFSLKYANLHVYTRSFEADLFLVTYFQSPIYLSPPIPQRLKHMKWQQGLRTSGPWRTPEFSVSCLHN